MAEEEEEQQEEEESGGKSNKMMIIIAAVVLIAGGAGAFFAMSGGEEEEEDGEYEEMDDGGDGMLPSAVLPLDTFVVNLQVKGSFLKVTMQLEFTEPELPATIEGDIPKLRDVIIRIMSSKGARDILSTEGKELLREEIRDGINETLGAEDVSQVYFTEFIIQ